MPRARVGIHARNDTSFPEDDYRAIEIAGFETLKLLSFTKLDAYARLRSMNPQIEFIVRLWDDRIGTGTHPSPQDFVSRHLSTIKQLKPYVTKFEIHNEPNHHERYEGWGSTDADARDFRSWYLEVLRLLRQGAPWAKFGFPGLAINEPHRDLPWLDICKDAIEKSDWLGVHCYWQYDNMTSKEWGKRFLYYHEKFPKMPLEITEFGDSTPNVPADKIAKEYPDYYRMLWMFPYVRSASAFILSSPDKEWSPFAWRKESGEMTPVIYAVGNMHRPSLEGPDYAAEFLYYAFPQEVKAGGSLTAKFKLKNVGSLGWNAGGSNPVHLGYHWLSTSGNPVPASKDFRTPLPNDIMPGDTTSLQATAYPPANPGDYTIQWDLVKEGVTWFAKQGSKPLSKPMVVKGKPKPRERYFAETGHTVRGAFLEFFEQYGLDMCGYPITDEIIENGMPTQYFQRIALEEYEPGKVRLKLVASDLFALRQRLTTLESYLYAGEKLPMPQVQDISSTLPADQSKFGSREDTDVRYLVIHHTAVSPDVKPEEIAKAHRHRWPGILYHYFVAADGTIYQTNSLDAVADPSQGWCEKGIQVCFAGDFSEDVPTQAQIEKGAELLAALIQKYKLGVDDVVGIGEMAPTTSPGRQWLGGKHWKHTLLSAINSHLASTIRPMEGELVRLKARVDSLTTEVVSLEEENRKLKASLPGHVKPPPIQDISESLPKAPGKRYAQRDLSSIRYLVISHTATRPSVSADAVARAHINRGYPGTFYHFFVRPDGTIQQTNPLTAVADPGHSWLAQGVVIGFAGRFDENIPTDAQIKQAGQLCAYLIQTLDLNEDAIKGLSELVSTGAPGWQWLHGKKWKNLLVAQAEKALEEARTGGGSVQPSPELQQELDKAKQQIQDLQTELQKAAYTQLQLERRAEYLEDALNKATANSGDDALKKRIQQLQDEKNDLQNRLDEAKATIAALQVQIANLRQQLADVKAGGAKVCGVPKPPIQDVVDKLPKNPDKHYGTRKLSAITHIAVHHSAAPANISVERIARYHVEDPSHRWPGIGYHFYIGPDGTTFQTNRLETISYQVKYNNDYTIGICFAGNFNHAVPTPAQISSGARLIAWLMQELHIPLENVKGHKEYPRNTTNCPGEQWLKGQRWKDMLRVKIQAVLRGEWPVPKVIDHYVLFWQTRDAWAREDWLNALNYIGRFRPTAGFSIDDAMAAKKVTIVGGPLGVSEDAEAKLVESGCQVERLAGANVEETKAILDELAKKGTPFKSI